MAWRVGGTQSHRRSIAVPKKGEGRNCTGPSSEEQPCNEGRRGRISENEDNAVTENVKRKETNPSAYMRNWISLSKFQVCPRQSPARPCHSDHSGAQVIARSVIGLNGLNANPTVLVTWIYAMLGLFWQSRFLVKWFAKAPGTGLVARSRQLPMVASHAALCWRRRRGVRGLCPFVNAMSWYVWVRHPPRLAAISAWIVKLLTGQLGRAAARAVMVVCQIELAQKCTLAFAGLWIFLVYWCSMFFSLSSVLFCTAPSESGCDFWGMCSAPMARLWAC